MFVVVEIGYRPDLAEMAFDSAVTEVDVRALPEAAGVDYDVTYAPVPVPGQLARRRGALEPPEAAPFEMALAPQECTYLVRARVPERQVRDLSELPEVLGVFADPVIEPAMVCPGSPAVGDGADVARLLGVAELQRAGLDGRDVLLAIVDTGVNLDYLRTRGRQPRLDADRSWQPTGSPAPGAAPVDHGTMCAYDALIAAPAATLLDVPLLRATGTAPRPVVGPGEVSAVAPVAGLLSDAVRAFRHLIDLMTAPAEPGERRSLVVSNSWGMFDPRWDLPPGDPGNYSDNPGHPFNRIVAELERVGADILFAAGNCGPDCPDRRCVGITTNSIYGANGSPSVLCVGGVDTTGELAGYSSVGPGRLARDKPDVCGYTHFRGSGVYPVDGGTSAATPVAAGLVAAVRSGLRYDARVPATHPAAVRQLVTSTARDLGPAGYDFGYGHGAVDGAALVSRLRPPLLVQFRHRSRSRATLQDAATRLQVPLNQVDPEYGVVLVADEPAGALYVCQVDAADRDQLERALVEGGSFTRPDPAERVFANPPIEPFGPPTP